MAAVARHHCRRCSWAAALGLLNGLLIILLRLPSFIATLATLSMILGGELLITQGETVTIHDAVFSRW